MFIKAILRILLCVSAMLQYSDPAEAGLLGSSGDTVSWLLFIVFLCSIRYLRVGR